MNEPEDLLQIKIDMAKKKLPESTQEAISRVDWKQAILGMREKKGYTFEQLGDLEVETELLLSGLVSPEEYPKELEKQMGIPKSEAAELVKELNILVFERIKHEMIKILGEKKINSKPWTFEPEPTENISSPSVSTISGGKTASPNTTELHPLIGQKFTGSFVMKPKSTEHSLANISKLGTLKSNKNELAVPKAPQNPKSASPASVPPVSSVKIAATIDNPGDTATRLSPSYEKSRDPYRLSPDE